MSLTGVRGSKKKLKTEINIQKDECWEGKSTDNNVPEDQILNNIVHNIKQLTESNFISDEEIKTYLYEIKLISDKRINENIELIIQLSEKYNFADKLELIDGINSVHSTDRLPISNGMIPSYMKIKFNKQIFEVIFEFLNNVKNCSQTGLETCFHYNVKISSDQRLRDNKIVFEKVLMERTDIFGEQKCSFNGINYIQTGEELAISDGQSFSEDISTQLDGIREEIFKVNIQFITEMNLKEMRDTYDGPISPLCGICREPLVFPLEILSCHHIFDKHCIQKWLQKSSKSNSCPYCGSLN